MLSIIYYISLCAISFLLLLIYVFKWQKRFDVHMTILFVLIPLINLSYFMMYTSKDTSSAINALKFAYVGGCYLPWIMVMCVASLCKIKISRIIKVSTFVLTSLMFMTVLTIGKYQIFYKSLSFETVGDAIVMVKDYGFMHTVYYIVIVIYFLADIGLIFYSYKKKKHVSRRILFSLFIPIPVTMIGYIINHFTMKIGIELVPLTYAIAQVVYLIITYRMSVYNVSDMVIETMVESGDTGFITTDFKKRYLGSNERAKTIIPDINELIVDGPINKTNKLKETIAKWIDDFDQNPDSNKTLLYTIKLENGDDKFYSVIIDYLYDGRKRCGFQIFFEDDTPNQKYIKLIDDYNSNLKEEVDRKTKRIVEMHNKLILGMATMVESRDNSTGGHIRRTSEGVRLLIEEMKKDKTLNLTEEFCNNIIKAAPMHDLGKIAVDDAILKKPGMFTPEEREKMKSHAKEGALIVAQILKDTDDEYFKNIAENVAHYHHEKVDGTGYPDGLKGNEIPLEARIMAIADVYDALVSKRVYKEKFSFEKANEIIIEGMGTQFDASLQKYYEQARKNLEDFYAKEQ